MEVRQSFWNILDIHTITHQPPVLKISLTEKLGHTDELRQLQRPFAPPVQSEEVLASHMPSPSAVMQLN